MGIGNGLSFPVDQIDHVVSILLHDHCSAEQCRERWSQIKHLDLIPFASTGKLQQRKQMAQIREHLAALEEGTEPNVIDV